MSLGFGAILRPLSVFSDIVPFIGFGTGLVCALAWLAARPLLGGALLLLAVFALIHALRKVHQNRTTRPATA